MDGWIDRQTDWQAVSIHSFALFSARRDFQPKVATEPVGIVRMDDGTLLGSIESKHRLYTEIERCGRLGWLVRCTNG